MTDAETYTANYERFREAQRKLGQINKATIFAALAAADIVHVLVTFDGEGDSGQIEDITASRQEESVPLPEVKIKLLLAVLGETEPKTSEVDIREAIETLCYDFLENDYAGWEDNDGACGKFQLDVPALTVELEFNSRFTDYSTEYQTY